MSTRQTISEAASKKPGRPRLWDEEWARLMVGGSPHVTHRHRQNLYYAYQAQWALHDETGNQPIAQWVRHIVDVDTGRYRTTLLSELGRLGDPELIVIVARLVVEQGLGVKESIAWLRGFRKKVLSQGAGR